jgi:hypothetical protein
MLGDARQKYRKNTFEQFVLNIVTREARKHSIKQVAPEVLPYLLGLADEQRARQLFERYLKLQEDNRTLHLQRFLRFKSQAINRKIEFSVRILLQTASGCAHRDQRTVLLREDMELAYKAHFCRVWPFCRGGSPPVSELRSNRDE